MLFFRLVLSDTGVLILVALLACLPFLQPLHYPPLGSFHDEWVALVLGLAGLLWLALATPTRLLSLTLPRALCLPALIALVTGVQVLTGQVEFRWLAYWQIGYLAWAMGLMVLAATLAQRCSRATVLTWLALGVSAGGVLSALLAFCQALGLELSIYLLMPPKGGNIYANIAQRNLLASYLWLGICCLAYLGLSGRMSKALLWVGFVLQAMALGLTASRLGYLHGLVLLAVVWWYWPDSGRQAKAAKEDSPQGMSRQALLWIIVACLGLQWLSGKLYLLSGLAPSGWNQTALERIGALSQGDLRLTLWRSAWWIFMEHPWWGIGVGNYSWHTVLAAAGLPATAPVHPGHEHSHNLLLQWLVDYGWVLAGLFVALFIKWALGVHRRLVAARASDVDRVLLLLLVILLVHSMLEYPLWYAEFLGLLALVVGLLSTHQAVVWQLKRRVLIPLCLAMLVAMGVLFVEYRQLHKATFMTSDQQESKAAWEARVAALADLAKHSVFSNYATRELLRLLPLAGRTTPRQEALCLSTMRSSPGLGIMLKCVNMQRLNGQAQAADQLEQLARRAYRYRE